MRILAILISLLLVTSIVFAEWTTDKDKALLELLVERQKVVEQSAKTVQEFGYTSDQDFVVAMLLTYLTKEQKQDLLNKLVDQKVAYNIKRKAEADRISSVSTSDNTNLNLLKE